MSYSNVNDMKNNLAFTMKKSILLVSVLLAMTSAMSQGFFSRQAQAQDHERPLLSQQFSKPLEPLLPFSDAVEKAKSGNAQGWYALAVHYAKGDEIDRDFDKAFQFMQKASDMNYSNAVFVATLLLEADCKTPTKDGRSKFETPPIDGYVDAPFSSGLIQRRISQGISEISNGRQPAHSITNASDIATIRAGYERAFSLGVSDATNALARFERRISRCQEEAKKNADEKKRKEENAKMVEVLEIDSTTPKKQ